MSAAELGTDDPLNKTAQTSKAQDIQGQVAQVMLLLHPIGLDAACWQFMKLGDAEAIDFPGHGDEPPIDEVTLPAVADHVAGGIDAPVHLVGLSLGGMVALHLALRHPDKVASLVVACSTAATDPGMMTRRAEETARGMETVLDTTMERWFTPPALGDGTHPGVEYARKRLLTDDAQVVSSYWRAMADHDVSASLGNISVPTTLIAGAADASTPVGRLRDIAAAVPRSRFEEISGPHMLQLECPEELSAALERHVAWATD